jgi:hypothetical protein
MRPQTRHYVALAVVQEAFSNFFRDLAALKCHVGKKDWFGPEEILAVSHNKEVYILGIAAVSAHRYDFGTAVKLLRYVTEPQRLAPTRAVILFQKNIRK